MDTLIGIVLIFISAYAFYRASCGPSSCKSGGHNPPNSPPSKQKNNYAGSEITLLDRDSGKLETFYAYPATKIVLVKFDGTIQKIMIVKDGEWTEINK